MKVSLIVLTLIVAFVGISYGHLIAAPSNASLPSDNVTESEVDHSLIYRIIKTLYDTRDSLDEFPQFITTRPASIIVAFLVGIYCFTFLALLCDSYFLPSVEALCVILNVSEDVAAATFMSMATTAPEFFVNIISTFISGSDLGLGTIVGSSSFNTLFTPALGCLAVATPLQLDWWPVTRDSSFYVVTIGLLVAIIWDGKVFWYEALVLEIVYIIFFTYVFLSAKYVDKIKEFGMRHKFLRNIYLPKEEKDPETPEIKRQSVLSKEEIARKQSKEEMSRRQSKEVAARLSVITNDPAKANMAIEDEYSMKKILFTMPKGNIFMKILFIYTWPLRLFLACIMPNHRKYPLVTPITFLICVVCIGLNSYVVSWMVTVIGSAFNISDTVMGYTLSAGGGALPEAFSLVIKARRGEGSMGVSNSLGGNIMNVLLSLGLPWFISTLSRGANDESYIQLQSGSIRYTVLSLVIVVTALYSILLINKFRLSRISGVILMVAWVAFLSVAVTVELLNPSSDT